MIVGNDVFGIALTIAAGSLAIWGVFRATRHQAKVFRSRNWPSIQGTVQKGEILQSGATRFLKVPFRSLLGYAYTVDGRPYWGLFVLIAEDRETAEKLQKQTEGMAVRLRYNPESPSESLLNDKDLLGRRVIQDPFYLDNS